MEDLVRTIALSLVDDPDSVDVRKVEKNGETVIELRVAENDMGKVIGRQGRIAKAIRTVIKAASSKDDSSITLEITQ